jgi:hypothetical protein
MLDNDHDDDHHHHHDHDDDDDDIIKSIHLLFIFFVNRLHTIPVTVTPPSAIHRLRKRVVGPSLNRLASAERKRCEQQKQ